MVAYSFQKRFEAPIAADTKLMTIRAPRKRHARHGEELQLYVGMRTKHCRLIGRRKALSPHNVVIDVKAEKILVGFSFPACRLGQDFEYRWEGQTARLAVVLDLDRFAVLDGFRDWPDMRQFWREEHAASSAAEDDTAFHGVVIRWAPGRVRPCSAGEGDRGGIDRELQELGL